MDKHLRNSRKLRENSTLTGYPSDPYSDFKSWGQK